MSNNHQKSEPNAKKKRPQTVEQKGKKKNGVVRLIVAVLSIVLQFVLIYLLLTYLHEIGEIINIIMLIVGILLVLKIYNDDTATALKMPWIMLILAFPLLGIMLYFSIGLSGTTSKMKKRFEVADQKLLPMLPDGKEAQEELAKKDKRLARITSYLKSYSSYPVYSNTDITYFDDAVKGLEAQKKVLSEAKEFIFMEYHAIEDAECWHELEEILAERAAAGVDVRVFYDDLGSIGFINTDFVTKMQGLGIQCKVFNPFSPTLNMFLNNRDHRKITVVDGKIGFTGGYNLANEYFHVTEPFGEWKDTGVMLVGEAVKSLTIMFLEMWNAVRDDDKNDKHCERFLPYMDYKPQEHAFVAPYADSPLDKERVGEEVYISMAEYAKDYIWFVTPYLIITDEMIHCLSLAAKRGVDVRIITPGIPDKKLVYSITQSYYYSLVRNGVRIFEFTPGFCHAKMSITDDTAATCGTINLDYRSLYHHFENGCFFANCNAVMDVKQDFITMMERCHEVTEEYKDPKARMKLKQMVFRLVAPLM